MLSMLINAFVGHPSRINAHFDLAFRRQISFFFRTEIGGLGMRSFKRHHKGKHEQKD
ncbi:hypothetical protein [Magnetovibrio sp.]|uniref:hypothetical protein n=1 Tax=Magnetovibrio sp. TaxID=2024836 RepID=UPI002F93E54D